MLFHSSANDSCRSEWKSNLQVLHCLCKSHHPATELWLLLMVLEWIINWNSTSTISTMDFVAGRTCTRLIFAVGELLLLLPLTSFSVLTLLIGWQEECLACQELLAPVRFFGGRPALTWCDLVKNNPNEQEKMPSFIANLTTSSVVQASSVCLSVVL